MITDNPFSAGIEPIEQAVAKLNTLRLKVHLRCNTAASPDLSHLIKVYAVNEDANRLGSAENIPVEFNYALDA